MNEANSAPSEDWKKQFMDCLAVPVFADMRQQDAIALRDKNKPDSLFRYRALNQEREFENIERQQVWLSQPLYLNDPFDSSFAILHKEFIVPQAAQRENVVRLTDIVGDKLSESEIAEFCRFPDLPDDRSRFLFEKAFPDEAAGIADMVLATSRKVF
jgi:hypothetical protein